PSAATAAATRLRFLFRRVEHRLGHLRGSGRNFRLDRRLCCPDAAASAEATEVRQGHRGGGSSQQLQACCPKRHAFRWGTGSCYSDCCRCIRFFALTMAAAEAAAVAAAAGRRLRPPRAAVRRVGRVEPAVRCCLLHHHAGAAVCARRRAACLGSRRISAGSQRTAVRAAGRALDLACRRSDVGWPRCRCPLLGRPLCHRASGRWAPLLLSVLCLLPLPILLTLATASCCHRVHRLLRPAGLSTLRRRQRPARRGDARRPAGTCALIFGIRCIIVQVAGALRGRPAAARSREEATWRQPPARKAATSLLGVAGAGRPTNLDRLVTSLVPQSLAAELKLNCLRGFIGFDGCRVAQASGVAVVSPAIDGLTNFPAASFASADAARLLHQLLLPHGPPHSGALPASLAPPLPLTHGTLTTKAYRGSFDWPDTYLGNLWIPPSNGRRLSPPTGIAILPSASRVPDWLRALPSTPHIAGRHRLRSASAAAVLGQQRIVYGLVGEAAQSTRTPCSGSAAGPPSWCRGTPTWRSRRPGSVSAETGPILPPESGVGGVATVSVWTDRLSGPAEALHPETAAAAAPSSGPSLTSRFINGRFAGDPASWGRLLRLLRPRPLLPRPRMRRRPSRLRRRQRRTCCCCCPQGGPFSTTWLRSGAARGDGGGDKRSWR
uniref:Protein kinase domain-containing protein n=1 Tax=Macrostomum lignano TaxID=282301 RepID=A0A1I8FLN3_9PLAT